MEVILLVCAQSAVIDQQTNALSIFNIVQELSSPSFPFAIGGFTVSTIFTRDNTEIEDPTDVRLKIHLQGKQIVDFELVLKFQGRTGLRHVGNFQGLLLTEPGNLIFSIHQGEREMGHWTVLVQHIGTPVMNAENSLAE